MNAVELFQEGRTFFDQGQYLDAYPLLERAQAAFNQQPEPDPVEIEAARAIRAGMPVFLRLARQDEIGDDNYLPALNRLLKLLKG
jgi:hypothetical protein